MTLLQAQGLTAAIGGHTVCRDFGLTLEPGQVWGLLGGNGAGKTTLLHTLAGLRQADEGEILLGGEPLHGLSRRHCAQQLGVLLQDESSPFPATVLETVLQGRHPHLGPWQWESAHDRALARAALEQVELDAMAGRRLDQLSGGERQRLRIATLLVQAPRVWLLDEPTNHLDLHHQVSMLTLLCDRARNGGGALLMSLHDLNLAARFCDRLILLHPDGEPEQGASDTLLTPARLSRLYGHPVRRLETEAGAVFVAA